MCIRDRAVAGGDDLVWPSVDAAEAIVSRRQAAGRHTEVVVLAEAGHPNGIDLGDYIVVAANALDVQCAQVLQQQWAAAGIKVNLKPMETAPLLSMWLKGEFGLLSVVLS